jgi:uncharacterized protein YlxW (UPF0749 family)
MKKLVSQINIAIVCAILGFMLTYHLRSMGLADRISASTQPSAEFAEEINRLQSQIEQYNERSAELLQQIKNYEDVAKVETDNYELKGMITLLDNARILLGIYEAKGSGVVVTINPKTSLFQSRNELADVIHVDHVDLLYIVNELMALGAEAVSINDKRITARSGIKSSSGNSYILVNDEKVSPRSKIEIKAIGNSERLQKVFDDIDLFKYIALTYYDIEVQPVESLTMPTYNKSYSTRFVRKDMGE